MSHRLQDVVWEKSRAKGSAKLVLLCIAEHRNSQSGRTFPSVPRLVARTGLSRRTVLRALDQLETLGELVRVRGGGRLANTYEVVLTSAKLAPLDLPEGVSYWHRSSAKLAPASSNTTGNENPYWCNELIGAAPESHFQFCGSHHRVVGE